MKRSATLAYVLLLGIAACRKPHEPTPEGTTLIDWKRSSARLRDPNDSSKAGAEHPIARAHIAEGPIEKRYRVELTDPENKGITFDLVVGAAKVSYQEKGRPIERWATTSVSATLVSNEAFRVDGRCDDLVGSVLGGLGQVTDTLTTCRVLAKRPNHRGLEDAIAPLASLVIEGNGKVHTNHQSTVVEQPPPADK